MPKLFIMTVGVQYGRREDDEPHPLGIFADEYVVIEAPNEEMARAIAFAITDRKFAFLYDYDSYPDEKLTQYHPAGERLRIAWIDDPAAMEVMAANDAQDARTKAIRTSTGFPLFDLNTQEN